MSWVRLFELAWPLRSVGCHRAAGRLSWLLLAAAFWPSASFGQPLLPKASVDPYFRGPSISDSKGAGATTQTGLQTPSQSSVPAQKSTAGYVTSGAETSETEGLGEPFQPGQVVAIVGGEPIFVADMLLEINQILDKYMPTAPAERRAREQPNLVRALVNKYVDQRLLAIDTKRGLPENVEWSQLIEQAAKDFDQKALPLLMEKSEVTSPAQYDGNLRIMGSSLRKMRMNWCEEQIIRYFLGQKIETDPVVSREEMLDYYNDHQDEYAHPARVHWEELMIRFDRCSNRDEAFEKIVELGNQVVYGASFSAVAARDSHGTTAHQGGNHGWITRGSLRSREIEDVLFEIPPQQLSDLIETDRGVHIVRVVERQEEHLTPFVEVQSEIREKLVAAKRESALQEYLAKVRQSIPVEYQVEPITRGETGSK